MGHTLPAAGGGDDGDFGCVGAGGGLGHLEKSAIERLLTQARADAGMSLNCCIPLELEFSRYFTVSKVTS
jgi:hypothetical protein